jgi:hypothetical protein
MNRTRHSNKQKHPSPRKTQKKTSSVSLPVYSKEDFESQDGMLTTVWGPMIWSYLHCMSFNYPNCPTAQDKKKYREFILQLQYVLPCGKCRKNLKKNLKKLPITMAVMESRNTFSRYVYELHEVVNTMLGKKSNLTFEDVRETFEHFRARCVVSTKPDITTIENGCVQPLYGKKAKCIVNIVPQDDTKLTSSSSSFQVDSKCVKTRLL